MNTIKDWLGIKSPSAEAAKEAQVVIDNVITPFLEGFAIGMARHANCRSEIVFECDVPDEPKYWDVKAMPVYPDEPAERYQMRRLLESIPLGGVVDGKAYLIVYNRRMPEKSYVICEGF
jgi:hypothetical protein